MDRITRIRIENVRAIESIELELGRPVTVLIGENGSGKSTIIECIELLRRAADPDFMQQFYRIHRGMPALLRKGASTMSLGVDIEDDQGVEPDITYGFSMVPNHAGADIHVEKVFVHPADPASSPVVDLYRTQSRVLIHGERLQSGGEALARPERLAISSFGVSPSIKSVDRVLSVLRDIEVHLGFDTLAGWAQNSIQRQSPLRSSTIHLPAARLDLLGSNLASAWSTLKNLDQASWRKTMDLVRLGLGESVDSINTVADLGGGQISLALKMSEFDEPIPAHSLSDGQLTWLAFIAMCRLNAGRSLMAIDEPETHLHPSLLGRVMSMLTNLPGKAPVVVGTHSDRVLEMLDDPSDAVRVCRLEAGHVEISRVDPTELKRWLGSFNDFSEIRSAGYLDRIIVPVPRPTSGSGPVPE